MNNDIALKNRRVRYLYEAVLQGSVRAAADKMDLNPSVVSRQISLLEAELSITLIERHGRGIRPTEAGLVLVSYYRQLLSNQEDALAEIQDIRGMSKGHIRLVLGEGFVSDLMDQPLQDFWRKYPNLTVTLNLAGTNEMLRIVAEDEADIGLVYNPPVTSGIRSHAAVGQPMCAILAPDHVLAKAPHPLTLKQLAAYPVAVMHGSYGTRQTIQRAEQADKVRLNVKLTTSSITVIKHFIRAGFGISLLPAFSVSQEIKNGEMVAVPVDSPTLTDVEAHIVTRIGRQLSPAANQLLRQLMATMKAFGEK